MGGMWAGGAGTIFTVLLTLGMLACVLAALHHTEVIAHRLGEPYGTLVLAVAVTIIEVALIVSLMLSSGPSTTALARDTVFAAVMIILNGMVGLCLLVGGTRHGEQSFDKYGVNASLATLAAIAVLTMVLPNFTTTTPGPYYSTAQLAFIAVVSVVLLATALAQRIESAVSQAGAPKAVVGVIIAAVVLLPEGLAALRAARANRLQTSLNLALGSALASIGLTIPAVAMVSIATGWTLTLGLDAKSSILLMLSLLVTTLSLGTGRTTVLQGVVHLVIFATYLFTTVIP